MKIAEIKETQMSNLPNVGAPFNVSSCKIREVMNAQAVKNVCDLLDKLLPHASFSFS
jgi:hypothetical protein